MGFLYILVFLFLFCFVFTIWEWFKYSMISFRTIELSSHNLSLQPYLSKFLLFCTVSNFWNILKIWSITFYWKWEKIEISYLWGKMSFCFVCLLQNVSIAQLNLLASFGLETFSLYTSCLQDLFYNWRVQIIIYLIMYTQ